MKSHQAKHFVKCFSFSKTWAHTICSQNEKQIQFVYGRAHRKTAQICLPLVEAAQIRDLCQSAGSIV